MLTSHLWFDLAAYVTAAAVTIAMTRGQTSPVPARHRNSYLLIMTQGVILGSLFLGTLNLYLSGITDVFGKSILGAICGGVLAVEAFKHYHQIRGSTGARLVPGLAAGIVIGRLGCFFAGLEDHTYGAASSLPWAVDFGDGVARHPVQLYESLAMLIVFLAALTVQYRGRQTAPGRWIRWLEANAFYLFVLCYAVQRFAWEFLKPYSEIVGPLNVFHLACLALAGYGLMMIRQSEPAAAVSLRGTQ